MEWEKRRGGVSLEKDWMKEDAGVLRDIF